MTSDACLRAAAAEILADDDFVADVMEICRGYRALLAESTPSAREIIRRLKDLEHSAWDLIQQFDDIESQWSQRLAQPNKRMKVDHVTFLYAALSEIPGDRSLRTASDA